LKTVRIDHGVPKAIIILKVYATRHVSQAKHGNQNHKKDTNARRLLARFRLRESLSQGI